MKLFQNVKIRHCSKTLIILFLSISGNRNDDGASKEAGLCSACAVSAFHLRERCALESQTRLKHPWGCISQMGM